MVHYTYKDIINSYRSVGVEPGRVVYVTGNFGRLGLYECPQKEQILSAHLTALQELLSDTGTLMVPTHAWSLCNSNKAFDRYSTPSETGPFTEFVRQQEGVVRQYHPFSSTAALGYDAEALCLNSSRNVYGAETPFQRMIDADAIYLSVGQKMEQSISLVHHVEFVMGVPYRYIKRFLHPCLVDGFLIDEEFFLNVINENIIVERDKNRKILSNFRSKGRLSQSVIGRSFVESLSTSEFYKITTKLFSKDIYSWLAVTSCVNKKGGN